MDLKTLKKQQNDPIIRDHELIKCAIEEMVMLPTTDLCSGTATVSKKPLNEYMMEIFSRNLEMSPDDPRINTLGRLCKAIHNKRNNSGSRYNSNMYLLSRIHLFFGIPRRESK